MLNDSIAIGTSRNAFGPDFTTITESRHSISPQNYSMGSFLVTNKHIQDSLQTTLLPYGIANFMLAVKLYRNKNPINKLLE